jgi:hypothetical protein
MNTSLFSVQKARDIATQLRTSRHHGGGWSAHADRDMAREANEIHVMAQYSHNRML